MECGSLEAEVRPGGLGPDVKRHGSSSGKGVATLVWESQPGRMGNFP